MGVGTLGVLEAPFQENQNLKTQSLLLSSDSHLTRAEGEALDLRRGWAAGAVKETYSSTEMEKPALQIELGFPFSPDEALGASYQSCIRAQSPAFSSICSLCVKDCDFCISNTYK